jgi:uncharacterized membrane protein YjgN (DUF898 family)
MENTKTFQFHGGAGSYFIIAILSIVMTMISFGLLFPWALCMREGWKVENTTINGRKLVFNGTGFGLLGLWIKMWFFLLITFGIYGFWIFPRLQRWIVENTDFANKDEFARE